MTFSSAACNCLQERHFSRLLFILFGSTFHRIATAIDF
jgi:hypothetical protein